MTGGYPSGNSAFRCLTHGTAAESGAHPGSTSSTPASSGSLPKISMWTCGTRRNLANSSECHLKIPFTYPATMSVPWTGMAVGLLLSRMILVIVSPLPLCWLYIYVPCAGVEPFYYTEHIECHLDTPTVPAVLSLAYGTRTVRSPGASG